MSDMPRHSPGAEESGILALELIADLIDLLVRRGVMSGGDRIEFFKAAHDRQTIRGGAFGKRSAKFMRDTGLFKPDE